MHSHAEYGNERNVFHKHENHRQTSFTLDPLSAAPPVQTKDLPANTQNTQPSYYAVRSNSIQKRSRSTNAFPRGAYKREQLSIMLRLAERKLIQL